MYTTTTHAIRVTVAPEYEPAESDPAQHRYFWVYSVEIANLSMPKVQLLERHWHITDGNGQHMEVSGEGVVGKQPVLAAGETFAYTSGVPLSTASGIMWGSYHMRHVDGDARFVVDIPAFSLDLPDVQHVLN